jgi:hypothetical protein
MSTRPQFGRYKSLYRKTAVNTTFTTDILYKEDFPHYSIQIDRVNAAGLTASAQLKGSVDGVTYYDIGTGIAVGAGGTLITGTSGVPFLRVVVTVSAGSADFTITAHAIA